ncbi:MAG: ABC transporter ATP-binding protein [Cellvibrio sp.]|uniref:ABC transporter ATP-binding protein n=1 Tax=Cellvibrio sp. TaxID=1965322 RepID=UPI0031A52E28
MSLISLVDIYKHYEMGQETVRALDGVSLDIAANEYIAFTGASGSGKSTLMNILGALDKPGSGDYLLNGHNVAHLNQDQLAEVRNRDIGFIFQNFNLLPRLTALANVMQPLIYRSLPLRAREQAARIVLERVGLEKRMHHLPNQLSGGQRQRVAIARALVTRPSLLLADEPTGNLDSATTRDIMQLFDELHREGNTIVMVTHEPDIARHCRRVVRMQDGKISEQYWN